MKWVDSAKQLPNFRTAGSLYSVLHGRLENTINLLAHGPADIAARAVGCIELAGSSEEISSGLAIILHEAQRAAGVCDAVGLAAAVCALEDTLSDFPIPVMTIPWASETEAGLAWIVLAVEDDPVWQNAIRHAVDLTRQQLPEVFQISCEVIGDRMSAEKRFRELVGSVRDGSRAIGQNEPDTVKCIAVVDFGIPASGKVGHGPSRDEGLSLLRVIRAPSYNVPAVVLTTAPNFLGDHVAAFELGVCEYFLKGTDSEETLANALLSIVTTRPARKVAVLESTERLITVDDVEVSLDPAVFRTFSVLADESPEACTCEKVVDLLEAKYRGYRRVAQLEDYPSRQALNFAINWAAAKSEAGDSPEAVIAWFSSERLGLWRSLCEEVAAQGIAHTDSRAIWDYMERSYGGQSSFSEDYDPKNIEKHAYEIRKAIKLAFNLQGAGVVPEEEVLVNAIVDDSMAYRVNAQVRNASRSKPPRAFRVLVVENDLQRWQQPIRQLLQQFGYVVSTACCEEDALALARDLQPDILCLDMHLPPTMAAFRVDNYCGDEMAGIRVLKGILEFLPHIRAIAMTSYSNRDDIRVAADEFGVRVVDFVSKEVRPGSPWEDELVLKLHRIRQEIRRSMRLPLPDVPALPSIKLWRSRKREKYVEVFGKPWEPSDNQNKLLWILAESDNLPVPSTDIMLEIWGDIDSANKLKKLVQQFRESIVVKWFSIDDAGLGKRVGESILANMAKNGWLLTAHVIIED